MSVDAYIKDMDTLMESVIYGKTKSMEKDISKYNNRASSFESKVERIGDACVIVVNGEVDMGNYKNYIYRIAVGDPLQELYTLKGGVQETPKTIKKSITEMKSYIKYLNTLLNG